MKIAVAQIQEVLDGALAKKGILSFHLRREDVSEISGKGKQRDAYVVYSKVTHSGSLYGDGKELQARASFDVAYYYKAKNFNSDIGAAAMCRYLIEEFRKKGWFVLSGPVDIFDEDNDYNGIVFEVAIKGQKI
jgi:hypothetical protein